MSESMSSFLCIFEMHVSCRSKVREIKIYDVTNDVNIFDVQITYILLQSIYLFLVYFVGLIYILVCLKSCKEWMTIPIHFFNSTSFFLLDPDPLK